MSPLLADLAALCLLAASAFGYVALNVGAWNCWFRRRELVAHGVLLAKRQKALASRRLPRFVKRQTAGLTGPRLLTLCVVQAAGFLMVWQVVQSPRSLWSVVLGLCAYLLLVVGTVFALVSRIPLLRDWGSGWSARVLLTTSVALIGLAAHANGSDAVASLLRLPSQMAPYATQVGAALFTLALLAIGLLAVAAVFEVLMAIAMPFGSWKGLRYMLVLGISFLSLVLAGKISIAAATSARAELFLWSAVYEFDAVPASSLCDLHEAERQALANDPDSMRLLHLPSGLDKAVLIRRPPALFEPLVFSRFGKTDIAHRRPSIVRTVACFR